MPAKLYNAQTIGSLPWPDNEEGRLAKSFLLPLIQNGFKNYISNLDTDLHVLHVDDLILPVTVNNTEYDNAIPCSLYAHYVLQGKEFSNTWNWVLKTAFKPILAAASMTFKQGLLNKVVVVNNWFFSTNLYPHLEKHQVKEIVELLISRFPLHAILFRSIDTVENKQLAHALKKEKFDLLANRMAFFFNSQDQSVFATRIFKSDIKLLKESGYEILENQQIPLSEDQRLLDLYNSVYLTKHSQHNPHINCSFIRHALSGETIQMRVLRKEGRIDAMAGFYIRNGVMVSPFIGYDTSEPDKRLYRLISTVLYLEAQKRKLLFHLSAGASFYKKIRRGERRIEYQAIYYRHLPWKRRIPWKLLKNSVNSIGLFLMKLYNK